MLILIKDSCAEEPVSQKKTLQFSPHKDHYALNLGDFTDSLFDAVGVTEAIINEQHWRAAGKLG